MNRPDALRMVQDIVNSCTMCELHATRTKTVFSRGDGSSGLLIVGEAPGADEDRLGEPFVGASGKLVDKWLRNAGIDPVGVYVCNVLKCRPPENRAPTVTEISACSGYLFRQIAIVQPRVVMTLGLTAMHTILTDTPLKLTAIRGRWHKALACNADVMPTFHPAYVLRNRSASTVVEADFAAVAARLRGES